MSNQPSPEIVISPIVDAPQAPIIYFEVAPVWTAGNGIVGIALVARRVSVGDDGSVKSIPTVVAHLRGNLEAALSLKNVLDTAIATAEKKAFAATPTIGMVN